MTEADEAVYVYGVMASSAPSIPPVDGVGSAPIRAVRHGGLAALVSPITNTDLRARDVRAHWRVLEHAFEQTTVLPVRFGTVMTNEDDVAERLLEPNAERLAELLAAMDGMIQLNVKGRYDEESLLREILRETPALERLRTRAQRAGAPVAEQIALGQQVENAITQRRARDTAAVRAALEGLAVATRDQEVRHPDAFNIAFLVARESTDTFSAGVGEPARRARGSDRDPVRGSSPPVSFRRHRTWRG